jgi:hypothetical protein
MYPIQPCCYRMLSLASSGLLLLEVYLVPHSLNSPCASHALLAIQGHLVCGSNSCYFGHAQMLFCKLTVIVFGPLGRRLLSITNPCREKNQSLGW